MENAMQRSATDTTTRETAEKLLSASLCKCGAAAAEVTVDRRGDKTTIDARCARCGAAGTASKTRAERRLVIELAEVSAR